MQNDKLQTENRDIKEQLKQEKQKLLKLQKTKKRSTSKAQRTSTSKEDKYNKVRKQIQEAFSEEKRLSGDFTEFTYNKTDITSCLNALKTLDNLINSDKRNIILNSAYKGRVLKELKELTKETGFLKVLHDQGFSPYNYSISHCNFLIKFYSFAEQQNTILKCSLSLKFISKNFAIVKVFQDLGW